MPDRLGIVLVGLGRMGRNHRRVIQENSKFRLVAIVDPVAETPEAQSLGATKFLRKISDLNPAEFQCAVVASPTSTHFEAGSQILEMGKHLLMEKPLAENFESARRLKQLAVKNCLFLSVGHVERFNPVVRKLQEVIKGGWLGDPIHFATTRVGGFPSDIKSGDNVLLDLAVHDLDVLSSLIGPLKVNASICHSTLLPGVLDTAEILVSNELGVSASVHVNWITPTKIRTIRVTGTKGACFVDYILQTCHLYGGSLISRAEPDASSFKQQLDFYKNTDKIEFGVQKEEPLKMQLEHFYAALKKKPHNLCTADDAIQAVYLAEQAIEKSAQGLRRQAK